MLRVQLIGALGGEQRYWILAMRASPIAAALVDEVNRGSIEGLDPPPWPGPSPNHCRLPRNNPPPPNARPDNIKTVWGPQPGGKREREREGDRGRYGLLLQPAFLRQQGVKKSLLAAGAGRRFFQGAKEPTGKLKGLAPVVGI